MLVNPEEAKTKDDATEGAMGNKAQEIEVRERFLEDDGHIPKNPELPLLIYLGSLGGADLPPCAARNFSRRTVGAAPGTTAASPTTTTTLRLTRCCA
jgi:hypothetical protein